MQDDLSPEEEALEYRSLSPLAVGGLVLGVLSGVALLSPALSLLPVVAAVVSIAGLISVAASPETRTGHNLALSGLALSVAMGAATWVRGSLVEGLHAEASAVLADRFIEALSAGDYVSAYELTLSLRYRRPSEELARLYYDSDDAAAKQLAEFRDDPAVQALAGGDYARDPGSYAQTNRRGAILGYWTVQPPGEEQKRPTVVLELTRTPSRLAGPASWWVSKHKLQP